MHIETIYTAMLKRALYQEPVPKTVKPDDQRILKTPSVSVSKPITRGLGGTVIGGAGAVGAGAANAMGVLGGSMAGALGAPAAALGGFSLGQLVRAAGDKADLDRAIDRSVKAQQSTLNLYDNKYKPWQDSFYSSKGYVQKPTGRIHPDTGKPVMQWVPPTK